MQSTADQELVREVITDNRYLTLATTDGEEPWVAPIEYLHDEQFTFYFFSTDDSRHSRHIEQNPTVAIAIFDTTQPEYSADLSVSLRGVQIRAAARRLSSEEYPEAVSAAIDALELPMPPYSVYQIVPSAVYVPKVRNGVNVRVEVQMRQERTV